MSERRAVVKCEFCGADAVTCVRTDGVGVQTWLCDQCGDLKRWCPDCDQGWVRRRSIPGLAADFYSCDECDATCESAADIGSMHTNLPDYLDARLPGWSWADVTIMRETEGHTPAA